MSTTRIPAALRRRVLLEFHGRCAYCHVSTAITGIRLVVDHIVPEAAGGKTEAGTLCPACHSCNECKGARFDGLDPLTGERVPLFHPQQDAWRAHFRWMAGGTEIAGLTPAGRATVRALKMNNREAVEARHAWASVGWHPPAEDL